MSMIESQVKELKAIARGCEPTYGGKDKPVYVAIDGVNSTYLKNVLNQAADTIESLSAKLAAANMERSESYYNGGWIRCEDRLPDKKGWYLLYAKGQRPFVGYFKGKTFPLNNHYHEIIAWMPLPEDYEP